MSADEIANDAAPSSQISLIGDAAVDMNIGVKQDEGDVILAFDKLIQWTRLEPRVAMGIAELLIESAQAAQAHRMQNSAIIRPGSARLPGLPS